jgi:5'-3' exonuclease
MRALLDGDIYAFRPASSAENEDVRIAIYRMEEMIENTLAAVGADEFSIFLSGDNNFRYDIYPEYKANRTQPKPRHLKECKQYLIDKYQAQVSDGCEADDLLGIEQCKSAPIGATGFPLYKDDTIICSLDKDLRMIPGNHYSFEISGTSSLGKKWTRPAEITFVTPIEGLRKFYYQVLVGDSTDNIKGAVGMGPKKTERLLRDCTTEQEMFEAVKDYFSTEEELLITGQCLWIFRKPNDRWRFPETTERKE